MRDYIVKDSSIWQDDSNFSVANSEDPSLKMGVVRDIVEIIGPDIAYIVEVWLGGKYTPIQCTRGSRFGGVYNYEEITYRGFEPDETPGSDGLFDFKKGDAVLIAYLYGDSKEGVIISGFNHPGRPRLFDPADGVVYESEFNGVNKSINNKGEYTVTFKGMQTNIAELESPVTGKEIPAPEYDTAKGSSFYKFDSTGSYMLSDNAEADPQSIFIDKPGGKIVITSGKTILTMDKAEESYTFASKITNFNSKDEFNLKTKETKIVSKLVEIKASKIKTKGEWKQKGNIDIIGSTKQLGAVKQVGSLSVDGAVVLGSAATAKPLIVDIPIIIAYLGPIPLPGVAFPIKTILTTAS